MYCSFEDFDIKLCPVHKRRFFFYLSLLHRFRNGFTFVELPSKKSPFYCNASNTRLELVPSCQPRLWGSWTRYVYALLIKLSRLLLPQTLISKLKYWCKSRIRITKFIIEILHAMRYLIWFPIFGTIAKLMFSAYFKWQFITAEHEIKSWGNLILLNEEHL